ncbi:hypothetical protein [Pseudomonas avellanae]|nr:hypothetical protein [Pseudomonas avellanae]GGJ52323.1 hypothetical protein GCM10009085_52180 [Pseudomonas avellanae]
MSTKQTPESLTELLVSLMPGGDDRRMAACGGIKWPVLLSK